MQPHCRAVRQDAKTPRHQDSGRPPKAPQAPQRTRQRNSTNSSSPTYPHLPKRPHAANTQHLGKEQKGASPQCVIARRSAHNPTERRCPPAGAESDGSRRVFHAVPHDWHHLNKSRKRECGQQKPETSLYLASIVRGVPREKARREPVGSAPPTPRRCLTAAPPLPRRCPAAPPLPCCPSAAPRPSATSFYLHSLPSLFSLSPLAHLHQHMIYYVPFW